jgi:hypothetical protein
MYRLAHLLAPFLILFIILNLIWKFLPRSPSLLPSNPPLSPDKPKPHLHITPNNTFNIAIISDLHYGEDEATFGAEQDQNSTQVIEKILDFEEPDFVVISQSPPPWYHVTY